LPTLSVGDHDLKFFPFFSLPSFSKSSTFVCIFLTNLHILYVLLSWFALMVKSSYHYKSCHKNPICLLMFDLHTILGANETNGGVMVGSHCHTCYSGRSLNIMWLLVLSTILFLCIFSIEASSFSCSLIYYHIGNLYNLNTMLTYIYNMKLSLIFYEDISL
jgi:hypothetical protein